MVQDDHHAYPDPDLMDLDCYTYAPPHDQLPADHPPQGKHYATVDPRELSLKKEQQIEEESNTPSQADTNLDGIADSGDDESFSAAPNDFNQSGPLSFQKELPEAPPTLQSDSGWSDLGQDPICEASRCSGRHIQEQKNVETWTKEPYSLHGNINREYVYCEECGEHVRDTEKLCGHKRFSHGSKHEVSNHGEPEHEEPKHREPKHEEPTHMCKDCGKSCKDLRDLNNHKRVHDKTNWHVCGDCHQKGVFRQFQWAPHLERHRLEVHVDKSKWEEETLCPRCKIYRSARPDRLTKHMQKCKAEQALELADKPAGPARSTRRFRKVNDKKAIIHNP